MLNQPPKVDDLSIRPDAHWPHLDLIVELDGRQGHETTARFESYRVRDRKLQKLGIRAVRVTKRQLTQSAINSDLAYLGVRRDTVRM